MLVDDKEQAVASGGEMVHMGGVLVANNVFGACPGSVSRLEAIR